MRIFRGIAPLLLVFLLIAPPSLGLTSTTPPGFHYSPPYVGATAGWGETNITQGCGHFRFTVPPIANASSGRGDLGTLASARNCNNSNGTVIAVTTGVGLSLPLNSSLGFSKIRVQLMITSNASWTYRAGNCTPVPASKGYCGASASFSDYASLNLIDSTAGHSVQAFGWYPAPSNGSGILTTCSSGACNSSVSGNQSGHQWVRSSVDLYLAASLKPAHSYWLEIDVGFELYLTAYGPLPSTGGSANAMESMTVEVSDVDVR